MDATQRVEPASAPGGGRPKRWRWILAALGLFVALLGLGAWGGYQTAISARKAQEELQSAVEANFQFQLGVQDLQAGFCVRARDRFVYVIQLIPDYPQAQEQLVQASLCAGTGAPQPIAENAEVAAGPTPTPDLRGAETIFAEAQSLAVAQNWDALLSSLDSLRKNFPDFQPIEVDRLYYIAYRNRGVQRILPPVGDLERGIFDLNRAEQIGPLDQQADSVRQLAAWYILGASFWEVDWPQAVQYFEYLAGPNGAAPQLHDTSFFTATDRLAEAQVFYAQDLIREAEGLALDKQWCSAGDTMAQADAYSPLDSEGQELWTYYIDQCALNGNEAR
ncbi:MAG: hypothetical protein M1347_06640 [Chloroflexi bacterium]|nr:hypothetical protein [Chloroflexota bacterium]